jgi:hypothetical protein
MEEFKQSHRIIPFINSHLITISRNKYIIAKENPIYYISKYVQFNFDKNEFKKFSVTSDFHFVSKIIHPDYKILNNKKCTKTLYERINTYNYENLDYFPELKSFIGENGIFLNIYGKNEERFNLHICNVNSKGYVYIIVFNHKITAYYIDEIYHLQLGDSRAYVWFFDNNFVVNNTGDVYSVVLIPFNN